MLTSSEITIQKNNVYNGHKASVFRLTEGFRTDTFLSAAGDGIVAEWQLNNNEDANALAVVTSSIFSILKLNENSLIAIGQLSGAIQIIDTCQKKEVINIKQSAHAVYDLLLHNNRIYAASGNGNVYCFDATDYSLLHTIPLTNKSIRCLIAVQEYVVAGASDSSIFYIDSTLNFEKMNSSHRNSIFSLLYLQKSNTLISGSRDAQLGIHAFHNINIASRLIPAHLNTVNHLAINPQKNMLATASRDKTIKLWDADTCTLLKVIDAKYNSHKNSVNNVFWTADNKYLISCGDDRQIIRWKIQTANNV